MYQPPHHREDRVEVQHALIRTHPLGVLITIGSSGLVANPFPFVLDEAAGPRGLLRAHIARANPQWRDYDPSVEALAIFQGPQAYITPSWCATKALTGKVVPTWNYVTVHAYGSIAVIEDRARLLSQISALTKSMEQNRASRWSVADAPTSFIEAMIEHIVGIEIPINRIEGKWKLSQNRPQNDREGVIAGLLAADGDEHRSIAKLMLADLNKQPGAHEKRSGKN